MNHKNKNVFKTLFVYLIKFYIVPLLYIAIYSNIYEQKCLLSWNKIFNAIKNVFSSSSTCLNVLFDNNGLICFKMANTQHHYTHRMMRFVNYLLNLLLMRQQHFFIALHIPNIWHGDQTYALSEISPATSPFKAIFNLSRLDVFKGIESCVIIGKNV